jgi:hypothetical protein
MDDLFNSELEVECLVIELFCPIKVRLSDGQKTELYGSKFNQIYSEVSHLKIRYFLAGLSTNEVTNPNGCYDPD